MGHTTSLIIKWNITNQTDRQPGQQTRATDLEYNRLGEVWGRDREVIIEEGEGGEAVDQLQLKHGKAILSKQV